MFSDVGVTPMIIQSQRGEERSFLDTAWTIQIVRGVLLWAGGTALAWPLAAFYGEPELRALLPAAAVAALLLGCESTSVLRWRRHLRLGRLMALEVGAQVVSIAVMVGWAWVTRSVWALVAGSVVGASVRLVASHALNDERDRLRWSPQAARELLHFGKWVFVSTVLTFFASQLDRLIFGKLLSMQMLGVYSIALMFASMPGDAIMALGGSVVFPALSRKFDTTSIEEAYGRARFFLLAAAGLGVAALAASGPHLIELLYDDRYQQASWMLQILVLGVWFRALEVPPGSAVFAQGRSHWLAMGHAAKVAGILVLLPAGYALGDLPGAIVGLAGSQVLLFLTAELGARRTGLRGSRINLTLSLLLAAATFAGIEAVRQTLSDTAPALVALLVSGSAASLVWLAGAYLLLRARGGSLRELIPAPAIR